MNSFQTAKEWKSDFVDIKLSKSNLITVVKNKLAEIKTKYILFLSNLIRGLDQKDKEHYAANATNFARKPTSFSKE